MKKAPDPDAVVEMAERSVRLKSLTEHPAWAELRRTAEEDRDKKEKDLLYKVTGRRGNGKAHLPLPLDQREIDRNIGYWEGVFSVLDAPDKIVKRAERMLETAQSAQQEGDHERD